MKVDLSSTMQSLSSNEEKEIEERTPLPVLRLFWPQKSAFGVLQRTLFHASTKTVPDADSSESSPSNSSSCAHRTFNYSYYYYDIYIIE